MDGHASSRGARWAALGLAVLSGILTVGALVLLVLNHHAVRAGRYEAAGGKVATYAVAAIAVGVYEGAGTLIATRPPRNPLGRLLGVTGRARASHSAA